MICAVVLAGGKARRMGGGDKPLLQAGGVSLLAQIVGRLAGQVEAMAISANADPGRFVAFGLPVLADGAFVGQGPLAGILAGMDWAASLGAEQLLSIPGDTPLIPADLAHQLAPGPAFAVSGGRLHPAVGLWPVTFRETLLQRLSQPGSRSVRGFAETIGARQVEFSITSGDPFLNANTPADLAEIRRIVTTET
jgi:molybdopterin-guanine dinucleotide biosynthesis protein A